MTYEPLKYDMREATTEEIISHYRLDTISGVHHKHSFRHFVVETARRNAKNGVAHKEHGHSTLRVISDQVFVLHHGKLQEVTAQIGTISGMTAPSLFDLRIKSEYLPTTLK